MTFPAIGYWCGTCRHLRANYTCDAFPGGLPAAILAGYDHRKPLDGDNGIVFEPRRPGEAAPAFDSFGTAGFSG
jgi:hypothetical protein